jgi:hypothetical protein
VSLKILINKNRMGTLIAEFRCDWLKGALLACVIFPLNSWGVIESTTENFVTTATTIQGNGGTGASLTAFALQAMTPSIYVGTVSSLNGLSLIDTKASWQDQQFSGSNGLHYVEFASGMMADITQTAAGIKTLTLAGGLPSVPAAGSTFKIHKHLTIADVFGTTNQAGLQPGPNANQADNVILFVPQTQEIVTIFYSNVPGFNGWYLDTYDPAGDLVVYPEQGLMVRSKTSRTLSLVRSGVRRTGAIAAPVFKGFNLVGQLKAEAPRKLSQLNLYSGDPSTGLAGGSNPDSADALIFLNPDTTTSTYFYSDYPGFQGWFDNSYRPADNVSVAPGTAFFILRKQQRGLFYWTMP